MPSDRKKKKAAQARAKAQSRGKSAAEEKPASDEEAANGVNGASVSNGTADELKGLALSDRVCTGVLTSHPESRDLHVGSLTVLFHGHELLQDSTLELNHGRCGGGGREAQKPVRDAWRAGSDHVASDPQMRARMPALWVHAAANGVDHMAPPDFCCSRSQLGAFRPFPGRSS